MARFKDYKLLAAVLGILVTAGPVLWFSAWLQKQGEAEISVAASWTIGNVDAQLGRAVAALDELAGRGVDSCGAAELELLRRSLLSAGPVKELSVVGVDGQTLCTDRGGSIASREVVSSTPTADPSILLDVVRLDANPERMLRVRRLTASGVSLAAILPAELLLPQSHPTGAGSPATPALRSPTTPLSARWDRTWTRRCATVSSPAACGPTATAS